MDKATFFSTAAHEQTTAVELSMGTVHVRALTRAEVDGAVVTDDELMSEANTFAAAVTDPQMTGAEWREWFGHGLVSDYVKLAEVVKEVSGIGKDAAKSAVRRAPKRRKH
jgi:hypothetical protein